MIGRDGNQVFWSPNTLPWVKGELNWRRRNKSSTKATKKISDEKAYELILSIIRNSESKNITAEEIAIYSSIKISIIRKVFMRLNREGILSQKKRYIPHDTSREYQGMASGSGWGANYYTIEDLYEKSI